MGGRFCQGTRLLLCALSVLALVGCAQRAPVRGSADGDGQPTATVAAMFLPQPTATPRPPTAVATATSSAPASLPTIAATADPDAALVEVPIYADELNRDWTLANSFQMDYDLEHTEYVETGVHALQAAPQLTTGVLYFSLKPGASRIYRRDQVQSLRFRLSGGAGIIDNEALLVTVVGSNAHPYWVENDNSVTVEGQGDEPLFSETRLSFLNINRAIPPETWVEVEVYLDDLLYDPDYTYVTGFYFKTEKQDLPVFYIDQVSLFLDPGL